jgi:tetratricopeptide (TPR) repeat protein
MSIAPTNRLGGRSIQVPRSRCASSETPRPWTSAILALTTIVVAAAMVSSEPSKASAQAGAVADERGIVTSRVVVIRAGEGEKRGPAVALARPSGTSKFEDTLLADQSILARELVRQALLIAARDELGLLTRDEILDDVAPPRDATGEVVVASVFRTDGPGRIVLRRGNNSAAPLADKSIAQAPSGTGLIAMVLTAAEGLSRTGFPAALKELGLVGQANRLKASAPLPADVDKRLEGLGLFDQFSAIRDLHEAIRLDGESPERLGALARAYAQLGILTEFQWHPAHKAYKARALLYAQRLVARDPGSAWALRNRAFVKSTIGLHKEALDDLAEAAKRADGQAGEIPAWIAPIEAYARNNLTRLGSIQGPQARLARLLKLLALEYPIGTSHSLQAARDVVELDEECYRAHDAMCRVGGVANLHLATLQGPEVLTRTMPDRLKAIANLPPVVKRTIDANAGELAFTEALEKAGSIAGDAGEPSWGALAHLIRETRFVQVFRRLHFMKVMWSVPVEDYWVDVRPFVAGHRYLIFLEGYGRPFQEIKPALVEFANKFDVTDLEIQEPELISATENNQTARGEKRDWAFATGHADAVARDVAACTNTDNIAYLVTQARLLLEVSPHSNLARTLLVLNDWETVKNQADAWEREANDDPLLLEAFSRRYRALKQIDRARKLLRRCVELLPQRSIYEALAATYKEQGDVDGWRKVLEEYVEKGEDHGLDHGAVQVEIARQYMEEKRWKEASRYAEDAAAGTGASWAMACAAECYESMEAWEQSETWAQQLSMRYPESFWPRWFGFCNRTGHGDLEGARAWTDAYLEAARGRPDLANPTWAAYYRWLSGSNKKALDSFNQLYAAAPTASLGLSLMLLADEAGDTARRDEVLKDLCTKMRAKAPKSIEACDLMRESLAAGKPLDLKRVDAIVQSTHPDGQGNLHFFVGKFLTNRGQAEAARSYLQKAIDSPQTYDWYRAIASALVRQSGKLK